MNELAEKGADVAAGVSASAFLAGFTIGQLNEWLQAGAFIVSIIAGLCAARYYWKKANKS